MPGYHAVKRAAAMIAVIWMIQPVQRLSGARRTRSPQPPMTAATRNATTMSTEKMIHGAMPTTGASERTRNFVIASFVSWSVWRCQGRADVGTNNTSKRRLRRRARRQADRFSSVPPERRRRLTGPQRRQIARRDRADAAQRRSAWWEWGPVTAGVLVVFELIYFFVVADTLGGASVAGVALTAALGFVAVCGRCGQEYYLYPKTGARDFPVGVIGTVSVIVMLVAIAVEMVYSAI